MEKITKHSLAFLLILYAVWKAVDYYQWLLAIDAGSNPTKLPAVHIERDGMTFFRFRFLPDNPPPRRKFDLEYIKDLMQDYLNCCVLPDLKELRPYVGGPEPEDVIEPIYIDHVEHRDGKYWIEVLYVDNRIAFEYVKRHKEKGMIVL